MNFFLSFPFDSKTPSGFLASGFFEALAGSLTGELFFDTLALTAGFCLYAIEFAADANEILENLNSDLESGDKQKHTDAELIEIRKKFNEITRFHSEVIELSRNFLGAKLVLTYTSERRQSCLNPIEFIKNGCKLIIHFSFLHSVFAIVLRIWIAVQYFRTLCMQLYRSVVFSFN